MDEEEFDAFMKLRPFGTEDAMRWDGQVRGNVGLSMTLGSALWGKTSDDLQRQLSFGTQAFTVWEARREIVRRAIDDLEKR
jgi:hypothetical protein